MKCEIKLHDLAKAYANEGVNHPLYLCHFIREMLNLPDDHPQFAITAELKRVVSLHFKLRPSHIRHGTLTGWILDNVGGMDEEFAIQTLDGMRTIIADPYDDGYAFRKWVLWYMYGAAPETVLSFEL